MEILPGKINYGHETMFCCWKLMLEAFCRWMNVLRFEPEFGLKFFLVYCIALRKFIFMLKFNKLLWYSLPYICSLKEMEKGSTKMVNYGIRKIKMCQNSVMEIEPFFFQNNSGRALIISDSLLSNVFFITHSSPVLYFA